jgi:hypothetical protein
VGIVCPISVMLDVGASEVFFFVTAVYDVGTSELFFFFEEREEDGVGNVCPICAMLDVGASEPLLLRELVDVVASGLLFIATSGLFFVFVVCFSGAMP